MIIILYSIEKELSYKLYGRILRMNAENAATYEK